MRCASTGSPGVCPSSRRRELACERHNADGVLVSGEAGFSLLEVLVALVIMAVALGALYPAFSAAVGATGRAESHIAAIQLAQSMLDQQTAGRVHVPGVTRGRHGSFNWTTLIEPASEELAPRQRASGASASEPTAPQATGWQLYRIVVSVAWAPQRQFTLETLHVTRPQ